MNIQMFDDINASHAATGYEGRTDLPIFHIFRVEDTYPHTRRIMPPYRFGFYQVMLLENSSDATLNMNTHRLSDLSDTLLFASPEHVLDWVRGDAQRGYITYFKAELLAHYPRVVTDEFPFFRLNEINFIRVESADKLILYDQFTRLLDLFKSDHPYRVPMLSALLLVLLFDCKRMHERQTLNLRHNSTHHAITFRFQQFVNQHYLTYKTVSAYAQLLNISPDYLGQVVRAATGKTPQYFISERILLEAKKLLQYSNLPVSEIAAYLGYSEPTHFGRFFRRHTDMSPLAWRQLFT